MRLQSGTRADWSISDTPDGWELKVRLSTPLLFLLPRYLRRNLPAMITVSAVQWVLLTVGAWWLTESFGLTVLVSPLLALVAIVLTLAIWPLQHYSIFGMRDRYLPDGTVLNNYLDLRYFRANRTITARAKDGTLDVAGNLFASHHLHSLSVDEDVNDGYPGMVDLMFAGTVVEHQTLFGWPGVPRDAAVAIRSALIDRADAAEEPAQAER